MAIQLRLQASLKRNSILKCSLLSAGGGGEEKEAVALAKGQVLNPIK